MPKVSLTEFVDFVGKSAMPKVTCVDHPRMDRADGSILNRALKLIADLVADALAGEQLPSM